MEGVQFAIADWAAMAPGLRAPSEWRQWAQAPWRPEGAVAPKLDAMQAMQRRRLSPLGRAAAEVAWHCHPTPGHAPVVFASAYGDAARCLQLLHDFAQTDAASPTDFTFSVHNAIGAMYSIARGDSSNYVTVSAGPDTAAAGVLEACSLLADGAEEVLLVVYDEPLPDRYAGFQRQAPCTCAWAWRVTSPDNGPHLSLTWSSGAGEADAGRDLPPALDALRFVLSHDKEHRRCDGGPRWTWSRRA